MSILYRLEVLKLNSNQEAIDIITPERAFGDLAGFKATRKGRLILDKNGLPQRKLMAWDLEFAQEVDGTYDFNTLINMRRVDWDEWITLPPRYYDLVVQTPKHKIRVPRVVQSLTYAEMNQHTPSLNFNTVYEIYGGRCAYTNRPLAKTEANLDHYIPRSKGGETSWKNIRLSAIEVNSAKGCKSNKEAGLPEVPAIIPRTLPMINYLKNHKGVPEWDYFLKK